LYLLTAIGAFLPASTSRSTKKVFKSVIPKRRGRRPCRIAWLSMGQIKNGALIRIVNLTAGVYRSTLGSMLTQDSFRGAILAFLAIPSCLYRLSTWISYAKGGIDHIACALIEGKRPSGLRISTISYEFGSSSKQARIATSNFRRSINTAL
jgi:hypothetical protein